MNAFDLFKIKFFKEIVKYFRTIRSKILWSSGYINDNQLASNRFQ